jgi:hypothetical protein
MTKESIRIRPMVAADEASALVLREGKPTIHHAFAP